MMYEGRTQKGSPIEFFDDRIIINGTTIHRDKVKLTYEAGDGEITFYFNGRPLTVTGISEREAEEIVSGKKPTPEPANPRKEWRERKRTWFGMPWTFTVYELKSDRLFVESGFLMKRETEMRLWRILDVSMTRSLTQRIFKMGSVHIESSDADTPHLEVKNIRNPRKVKEVISQRVEEERQRNRITAREFLGDDGIY